MQYLGGKSRIASDVASVILGKVKPDTVAIFEPFCGGCNVTVALAKQTDLPIFASDFHPALITLWQALQAGWQPPKTLSESEYNILKNAKDNTNPLTAFAGFGCSFGAKYFGGYGRPNPSQLDKPGAAATSLLEKIKHLSRVNFQSIDYAALTVPKNCIVYCDPPYNRTTKYSNAFDSQAFWQWVRDTSKIEGVTVLVSEFAAPSDFECIWQKQVTRCLRKEGVPTMQEKIFIYGANYDDK